MSALRKPKLAPFQLALVEVHTEEPEAPVPGERPATVEFHLDERVVFDVDGSVGDLST